MAILDNETKLEVKKILSSMNSPVEILFFDNGKTYYGKEIKELLNELAELNSNIVLKIYNESSKEVQEHKIDKFPAIVLKGKNKGTIRFFGIPSGYEFSTLLEDLKMLSSGEVELPKEVIDYAKNLKEDLHLMVFVTPTCPYCPSAVFFAHSLAMFNEKITSDMIEAMEFEQLSNKFHVSGVPHTVINQGKGEYVGAYPPQAAIEEIKKALNK
ncbi:MAG: thioredoxin family protein [Candidatus Woesearchaeota archaeon]